MGLTDATHVKDSSYEFAVVDSNSLKFVFKQAPEVAKQLNIGSEFSVENALMSKPEDWLVCHWFLAIKTVCGSHVTHGKFN